MLTSMPVYPVLARDERWFFSERRFEIFSLQGLFRQFGFDDRDHFVGLVRGVYVQHRAIGANDPILGIHAVGGFLSGVVVGESQPALIVQDGVGDPHLFLEGLQVGQSVLGSNSPNDEALVFVCLPQGLFNVRDLGRANRSPGREEEQDNWVPFLFRQLMVGPIGVGQDEIRRCFSHHHTRPCGCGRQLNLLLWEVGIVGGDTQRCV